jgi:hypothetical protein
METGVKVRVFLRSRIGTTIVWNTDALSQDEREHYEVQIQKKGTSSWVKVDTQQPPPHSIQKITMDGKTMATMIPNLQNSLDERDEFLVKLCLGKTTVRETILEVEEQHMPFVKPKRIESDNGDVVYAQPSYIVALSPQAIKDVANAVKNAIIESKDK